MWSMNLAGKMYLLVGKSEELEPGKVIPAGKIN
jgi:hypothetical protein